MFDRVSLFLYILRWYFLLIVSFCFRSSCPNNKCENREANVEFKDSLARLDFDSGENYYSNIYFFVLCFTHSAICLQTRFGKLLLHKYQGQSILHNCNFFTDVGNILYICWTVSFTVLMLNFFGTLLHHFALPQQRKQEKNMLFLIQTISKIL